MFLIREFCTENLFFTVMRKISVWFGPWSNWGALMCLSGPICPTTKCCQSSNVIIDHFPRKLTRKCCFEGKIRRLNPARPHMTSITARRKTDIGNRENHQLIFFQTLFFFFTLSLSIMELFINFFNAFHAFKSKKSQILYKVIQNWQNTKNLKAQISDFHRILIHYHLAKPKAKDTRIDCEREKMNKKHFVFSWKNYYHRINFVIHPKFPKLFWS